ncbi:T9SS type A sorting domain-containing protein [bacterium]
MKNNYIFLWVMSSFFVANSTHYCSGAERDFVHRGVGHTRPYSSMLSDPKSVSVDFPIQFVALTGFSGRVPLAWTAATEPGLLGYNIYRSLSPTSNYTQIASLLTQLYFIDESVNDGILYYYTIRADYQFYGNDYSDIVSATAITDGYQIQSVYQTVSPTIDGIISPGEWDIAAKVNIIFPGLSGDVPFYVQNSDHYLYLAVDDVLNTALSGNDGVGFFIDEDNSDTWSPEAGDEGLIQVYWNSGLGMTLNQFIPFHGEWPNSISSESAYPVAGVTQGISYQSGHVQCEIAIDMSGSPFQLSPGASAGFFIYALNSDGGNFTASWPQETAQKLDPITSGYGWAHGPFSYGHLILGSESHEPFWADIDKDGDVDVIDVQLVAAHWNTHEYEPDFNKAYDIDDDGDVDVFDIQRVAAWWNKPLPGSGSLPKQASESVLHADDRIGEQSQFGLSTLTQELSVAVDPIGVVLSEGEKCTLNVVIENSVNLGSFEFDITYDASIIRAEHATIGDFLASTGRSPFPVGPDIDNSSGRLVFGAASLGENTGPEGSGILASVIFSARKTGNTTLDLQNVQISDIYGNVMAVQTMQNGQVTVHENIIGTEWEAQNAGIGNHLLSVDVVSEQVVWIMGESCILKTVNGGVNWTEVTGNLEPFRFLSGFAFCADSAVVAAFDTDQQKSMLYKTTDGGTNWNLVYDQGGVIHALKFFDKKHGLALGDPVDASWLILNTDDQGDLWHPIQNPPESSDDEWSFPDRACFWPDDQSGWFVSSHGRIYQTANQGMSWTSLQIPDSPELGTLALDHFGNALVGQDNGNRIIRTKDYGNSWEETTSPAGSIIHHMNYFYHLFWVLIDQDIFITSDEGSSWKFIASASSALRDLDFYMDSNGLYAWAVGHDGTILKYAPESSVRVDEGISTMPGQYHLSQNQPNPFNTATRIRFSLEEPGYTTLKIFNLNAQQVDVLVQSYLNVGSYVFDWKPRNLPSGVYYCVLVADKKLAYRKLVYMK